jgi:hypothetical protein
MYELGQEEESKGTKSYFLRNSQMKILLGILVLLVTADGIISKFLVTHRLGIEWNPFLQTWVSDDKFLIIKLAGAVVAALIMWDIYRRNPKLSFLSTLCFVTLYTGIIYWNLFAFLVSQV